jgi:hypothetical protein
MDVTSATPRKARMAITGVGLAAGLVFALPVKTGSVACPPAHEGRAYCLVQHAWAPALIKVVAAVFVAHLLGELVLRTLPAMRARWRRGERLVRRETDRGRGAVLADPVLAAANWGIVPEPGRIVTWTPAAERELVPALSERTDLHALTLAERSAHPAGPLSEHLRVLDSGETRTRKLRRGTDPALVVACWSDASAARELDTEHASVTA